MTVAALRIELERETAVWGLAMMRPADRWERWELVAPLVHEHLPPQTRVRLPLRLLPSWYRNLWVDGTQIDGRVELVLCTEHLVHARGLDLVTLELATVLSIETPAFLDAVLAGAIGDSS